MINIKIYWKNLSPNYSILTLTTNPMEIIGLKWPNKIINSEQRYKY